MYKAKIATAAIRKALELASDLTVPVTIHCDKDKPEVHVLGIRALEQIPGDTAVREIGQGHGTMNVYELSREYDGVKFLCLLTQKQYEAYQR